MIGSPANGIGIATRREKGVHGNGQSLVTYPALAKLANGFMRIEAHFPCKPSSQLVSLSTRRFTVDMPPLAGIAESISYRQKLFFTLDQPSDDAWKNTCRSPTLDVPMRQRCSPRT